VFNPALLIKIAAPPDFSEYLKIFTGWQVNTTEFSD